MVPLLVAFLALPCLGQEAASKGKLSQLVSEEDRFHLLTEVILADTDIQIQIHLNLGFPYF